MILGVATGGLIADALPAVGAARRKRIRKRAVGRGGQHGTRWRPGHVVIGEHGHRFLGRTVATHSLAISSQTWMGICQKCQGTVSCILRFPILFFHSLRKVRFLLREGFWRQGPDGRDGLGHVPMFSEAGEFELGYPAQSRLLCLRTLVGASANADVMWFRCQCAPPRSVRLGRRLGAPPHRLGR